VVCPSKSNHGRSISLTVIFFGFYIFKLTGKTTLLNRIANWEELEGFPRHLRVLHVKQELHTENEETSVLEAVLEADVERTTLLKQEKEIIVRLEGDHHNESDGDKADVSANDKTMSIEERQKLLDAKKDDTQFADDLKQLKDIYERLTLLGADSAQSRAATILSGLQFTEEMQLSPIKSLSGGWRMRVALAAALLITPDILMLDEREFMCDAFVRTPLLTRIFWNANPFQCSFCL
jgi:ATP-binding cassette subfamily F protein 3